MWKPKHNQPPSPGPVEPPPQGGEQCCAPGAQGGCCSGGQTAGEGPDETAAMIDELQKQLGELARERDQAREDYTRVLADYSNSQRRALSNEQQAREQGIRGLLMSVMPVVDHFDLALGQDPSKASAKDVMQGVGMIKDELLRALAAHGITIVRPATNDPFDPSKHEAVLQQPAEGVEPGNVVATLRVGYTLGDRVVRPAQVSVAPTQ